MGIIANLRNRVWILEDENNRLREERQSLRDYISKLGMQLHNDTSAIYAKLEKVSRYANQLWSENNELRKSVKRMTEFKDIWMNRAIKWRKLAEKFERDIDVHKRAIEDTNQVIDFKNSEIANLRAELHSLRIGAHEANLLIGLQAREIEELREANERLENDPESVIEFVAEISVAHFEHVNDVIGIAPCGYGCSVKRDNSGRIYDAHEIGCPDSLDFDIENMRY